MAGLSGGPFGLFSTNMSSGVLLIIFFDFSNVPLQSKHAKVAGKRFSAAGDTRVGLGMVSNEVHST